MCEEFVPMLVKMIRRRKRRRQRCVIMLYHCGVRWNILGLYHGLNRRAPDQSWKHRLVLPTREHLKIARLVPSTHTKRFRNISCRNLAPVCSLVGSLRRLVGSTKKPMCNQRSRRHDCAIATPPCSRSSCRGDPWPCPLRHDNGHEPQCPHHSRTNSRAEPSHRTPLCHRRGAPLSFAPSRANARKEASPTLIQVCETRTRNGHANKHTKKGTHTLRK